MIKASVITKAVYTMLKKGLSDDYTVQRSEYINVDADKCPWVGVYRGEMVYDPRTLGAGVNNWRAEFKVRIVIQAASFKSGEKVEEDLEEYIKAVLDIINADPRLDGTVAMVRGISVNYSFNIEESESLYYQNAEIELTTEVRP